MNLFALGPGSSLGDCEKELSKMSSVGKIMAFQNVFPNCVNYFKLIPDYWVSGDPNAYIQGFKFLLEADNPEDFSMMKILIPSVFTKGIIEYRKYCGTTPLLRTPGAWNEFENLLLAIRDKYDVEIVECTTTKFLKTFSTKKI